MSDLSPSDAVETIRSITDSRLRALVSSPAPQARVYERELRSAERAYLRALEMAETYREN